MYGLKLKLDALANGYSALSMNDALTQVAKDMDVPDMAGCRLGMAAELDEEVSDLRAAKDPTARARFGVSPATLAKRLQRARRRNPFPLPLPED